MPKYRTVTKKRKVTHKLDAGMYFIACRLKFNLECLNIEVTKKRIVTHELDAGLYFIACRLKFNLECLNIEQLLKKEL